MEYVLPDTPFRVKGLVYKATRGYFDKNLGVGYDALLSALPAPLREFMDQPFLSGNQYEVMLMPDLINIEARVAGVSSEVYLRSRTRWQAEKDLGGVYKLIARVAPPSVVVRRVMVLLPQILNFGSAHVTSERPSQVCVELRSIPIPLVAWLERVVVVYAQTCLEFAQAKGVRVSVLPRSPGVENQGYPTMSLHFEVRWGAATLHSDPAPG